MSLTRRIRKNTASLLAASGYRIVPATWAAGDSLGIDYLRDITYLLATPGLTGHLERKSINTAFDVGANVGQSALRIAAAFPDAAIYAFEPVPETFEKLRETTRSNGKISPWNIGMGNVSTTLPIFVYEQTGLMSSVVPESPMMSSRHATETAMAVMKTIDSFCEEHKIEHIELLKIDTEGFDLEVLRGGEKMIECGAVSFIYFEFFLVGEEVEPQTEGGRLVAIDRFLSSHNFRPVSFYTDFIHDQHRAGGYNALYMRWK